MHGGSEGKTEANGGEALRIKAILVTTTKLTLSSEVPFTIEARPKTTISKVDVCVCVNPLGIRALFSTPVFPTGFFGMEFFSEAYERRVLRAFLMAEGVGRSGPIRMYSATPLCCASETEVDEGLLVGGVAQPM
jgi:hypothetical protein